jgi:hypothetical protein
VLASRYPVFKVQGSSLKVLPAALRRAEHPLLCDASAQTQDRLLFASFLIIFTEGSSLNPQN